MYRISGSFRLALGKCLSRGLHAQVSSGDRILGGTPVISGTRVPVYDVAASEAFISVLHTFRKLNSASTIPTLARLIASPPAPS